MPHLLERQHYNISQIYGFEAMARVGSKERIRQFLRAHLGEVVTARQLKEEVGPDVTEWARRVRELRQDEGWKIESNHDDINLKPGEYRLVELPSSPEGYRFSKPISTRLRAQVLERNGYTCQMCGAGAGEPDENHPGRTVRLHIGHIVDRSHDGKDTLSNLRALCSTCNQGAKNIVQEPPSGTWLLSQLRRASIDDQKAALDLLIKKFGVPPPSAS